MRGILRPCRHGLGRELHTRWVGHLCGLCLALRDSAGQAARVLTGYDVLVVSVLSEAQTGRLATTTAGPCPLRGFRTAQVVDASSAAMQAGTAVALLAGSAGLTDKVNDGDTPVWLRPMASRSARRLAEVGAATADGCGFDGTDLAAAPSRSQAAESLVGATLDELLEPAGTAVAAMFAHTAVASGVPANAAPLRRAGQAFGRIVNLVDAVEDRRSDMRRGQFNPLTATATSDAAAGQLARSLHDELLGALDEVDLVDGALAEALLGPTLRSAIDRVWGSRNPAAVPPAHRSVGPRRRGGGVLVAVAAAVAAQAAMWGGGRRRREWQNDAYGGDPYGGGGGGGGGYGRRGCGGPSCGQVLACDCLANCCCNDCCGGGDDCCCCAC